VYKIGLALLAAAMLASCQQSQASLPPLAVECLGPSGADCDGAVHAALTAVAASGYRPIHLWITDGLFCPAKEFLFDPLANCPVPIPQAGSRWVASVEVAFGSTDLHAGMYVTEVASAYNATVIGYRVPRPGWCLSDCPSPSH
jgi:hypothetical protein